MFVFVSLLVPTGAAPAQAAEYGSVGCLPSILTAESVLVSPLKWHPDYERLKWQKRTFMPVTGLADWQVLDGDKIQPDYVLHGWWYGDVFADVKLFTYPFWARFQSEQPPRDYQYGVGQILFGVHPTFPDHYVVFVMDRFHPQWSPADHCFCTFLVDKARVDALTGW
jgi:hypothetical protein